MSEEAPAPAQPTAQSQESRVEKLEERIKNLEEIYTKIQELRQIPAGLLTRHKLDNQFAMLLDTDTPPSAKDLFQQVKGVMDLVCSDGIQSALNDADKRIRADPSILATYRRDIRKRRHPISPEVPKPYVPADKVPRTAFFPAKSEDQADVTLETLVAYTRQFNKSQEQAKKLCRLHIWERTKEHREQKPRPRPHTMRFIIPDVLTAYIVLRYRAEGPDNVVLVQTVTLLGPRERKAPHTQSAFAVFRLLSQQISKMIRSEEEVPLRAMVDLLCTYEGLFLEPCTVCGHVLSDEAFPPVLRPPNSGIRHVTYYLAVTNPPLYLILPSPHHSSSNATTEQPPTSRTEMTSTTSASVIPDAVPSNVVISPSGIIHVLGYTPTEGERGVPITVRIHFHPELADAMYVRLVIGHKAVATKVRELPGVAYGRWQLDAIAPPFEKEHYPSSKVLISVQALNENNEILDSVAFGEFSYWSPGCVLESATSTFSSNAPKLPKLHIPSGSSAQPTTMRRRGATTSQLPSSTSTFASNAQSKMRIHRRLKTQSLVRAKHAPLPPGGDKLVAHTPILEMVTPLASICTGWTPAEMAAGRRLVRFSKVQDGRKLIVSCEPIRQEEYCETDAVISCIYREQVESCFVTSVDVIYLLERLTNGEFPVEEKNRIRRNLEGLRPTTVSKHKVGFGDFFQRIMEFPDPKPRNIEKDLKVFDWNLLGQALEKILSKYSIYTSADEVGSTSPVSDPSSLDSPELVPMQPGFKVGEELSHPNFVKFEPATNEYSILGASNGFGHADTSGDAVSPVGSLRTDSSSSSSSAFQGHHVGDGSLMIKDGSPWGVGGGDMKMPLDLAQLESLGTLAAYDTLEPISMDATHGFSDNTALDFSLYDTLSFSMPTMTSDEAIGLVGQHYVGSV